MSDIFVGQTLKLEFTVADETGAIVPLQNMTKLQMSLRVARGPTKIVTATLTTDGSDGKVEYTTNSTDLDNHGLWKAQVLLTENDKFYPASVAEFEVLALI